VFVIRRAIVLGLFFAAVAAAPAQALRAMSWNIAGSPVNSRAQFGLPFSLHDVEAVIARQRPDVLGLQESCSWEASAIARDLGYVAWHEITVAGFDDRRPGSGGVCDYGDALLVRPPLSIALPTRIDLLDRSRCKRSATQHGVAECRVLMRATIGLVGVSNTHIGLDPTQSSQLATLRHAAAGLGPAGIAVGDDNVQDQDRRLGPRMAALGYLDAGGAVGGLRCDQVGGCRSTFPSGGAFGKPNVKGDDLFVRGLRLGGRHGPVSVMVGGRPASDHLALVADVGPAPGPTGSFGVDRGRLVVAASEPARAEISLREGRRRVVKTALIAGPSSPRRVRLPRATTRIAVKLIDAAGRVGRVPGKTVRLR
jgi:endonuclease/exonuclease/phosphatase family metal-dependent hydrolase